MVPALCLVDHLRPIELTYSLDLALRVRKASWILLHRNIPRAPTEFFKACVSRRIAQLVELFKACVSRRAVQLPEETDQSWPDSLFLRDATFYPGTQLLNLLRPRGFIWPYHLRGRHLVIVHKEHNSTVSYLSEILARSDCGDNTIVLCLNDKQSYEQLSNLFRNTPYKYIEPQLPLFTCIRTRAYSAT